MSKKNKSNVIDFKKAARKKFNEENEIVFTIEGEDYQLGEMVHQAHNDNGMEFVFKLEEFDNDEPDETIHWSGFIKKAIGWRNEREVCLV